MSKLLDFYRGQGTDVQHRRLDDIWQWDDDDWEGVHDFIQWLFPLPEPSQFNPNAPLLTDADIAAFRDDPVLAGNLRKSFERVLSFLGLAKDSAGLVVKGPNFAEREPDVWSAPNHNWLRITRILRSLSLLGLGEEALVLFAWLEEAYMRRRYPISSDTFRYWSDAMR
jgi:hypothetical protein